MIDKSNWKKITARYAPTTNTVHINADSTEFYPLYVKYLFEYLKIPQNATIVFKDKTIKGGVKEWLAQE